MLKQRFFVQFGTNLINQILGMAAGLIVARLAGPGVLGLLSFGLAYVSILGFVNGLFGSAHIKLVSEGRDHPTCMGTYTFLQGATVLTHLVATLMMFLYQKYIQHYQFESKDAEIIILLSLLSYSIGQYDQYAQVIFTAKLQQAKANFTTFLKTVLWHIGRVLIVVLGYRAITLSSFNLALTVLFVPVVYHLLRSHRIGSFDKVLAKSYVAIAIPGIIIEITNAIIRHADKLVLAHYTSTLELGYYSAAYSLGGMFMVIAAPVGSIFFPLFSGLIKKGDWKGLNANIRKYEEFVTLFVFPTILAFILAGGNLLLLILGERYLPSVKPFSVMLITTYITLIGLPYGNVLTGMGRFYLWAWINVGQLVLFLISITVFLSPEFLGLGAMGLALNLLVMRLYAQVAYVWAAHRFGEMSIQAAIFTRHVVIIAVSLMLYAVFERFLKQIPFWWAIYIPLDLVLVYGVLGATRLLTKEHLAPLKEALNLKKTVYYVNEELKS